MTLPYFGRVRGTTMKKRASPCSWRRLIASSSALPPMVSFARTRTLAMATPSRSRGGGGGWGFRLHRLENAVHRAGDAVLVRAADHGRDLVEVEDRRRRGHLPLERQRAPRVTGRRRAASHADHHVVEEHERRRAEEERCDGDERVPVREH